MIDGEGLHGGDSPPEAPVDLGIPGLADYRVVGTGGFATVYSARDDGFDRTVAVKVMHNLDGDGRRRFDRERRIMGRLAAHPNVLTPFQAGYTAQGAPYLVMEFIDGGSLDDELRRHGPLAWTVAVDHTVAATSALAHAHAHDVLHRDVKPANIMVADGTAKLTDFGIAAIRGIPASQVAYTLAHSPPETFAHGPDVRDERSDLYSMGSTLYTLLTGRAPFEITGADSQQAYMFRIIDGARPPLPDGVAPPEVSAFLERALAQDPADRPATATEFGHHLAQLRAGSGLAAGGLALALPAPTTPNPATPERPSGPPPSPSPDPEVNGAGTVSDGSAATLAADPAV
ncbi:MAG: serine/threonine-protein kinase, partial [Actinomycetota bacterium]